ncbi:hypothetical protein B4W80_15860 (plasmid) [Enterococcus faecium]|nr:hypothetical protein B4W80_15860 [Enterococcus faecium]OZN09634.1 hypothetical protein CF593_16100 [Enterococcus faecium]OZN15683.1 hypothetical protein CF591_14050 [Enterococcus faecium]OZN18484.1 hypothetical protein CF590_14160 [Enterococcus faecium]OZN21279.1 hypothetical protein CF589_14235 [Enterococcus faecium]
MLAEIGPIERFSDEIKLTKYAGLYWRQSQSGKSEYENFFTKSFTSNIYFKIKIFLLIWNRFLLLV